MFSSQFLFACLKSFTDVPGLVIQTAMHFKLVVHLICTPAVSNPLFSEGSSTTPRKDRHLQFHEMGGGCNAKDYISLF